MLKFIVLSLAALYMKTAVSQCLNRSPNIFRPEAVIEAVTSPQLLQPGIENPTLLPTTYPSPTTIITDCTPSVCQNLVNTIQLMIVTNLLRNTREGSELAQLAAPIISEVISSPAFACGCPNPLNGVQPQLSLFNPTLPNYAVPQNFNPSFLSNTNPNGLYGNIVNFLS